LSNRDEIERLRAEVENLVKVAGCEAWCLAKQRIAALEAENRTLRECNDTYSSRWDALEADRERLDWLQKQDPVDDIGYGEDGHLWQIGEFHCDDIREAIDKAREGSE
jgi:hypothetical protein